MPVTSHYDNNIIVIEMSGEYSQNEARELISGTFADTLLPKDAVLMIDLTKSVSIIQRSSGDIIALAEYINTFKELFHNRLALVTPDNLKYGLMRMTAVRGERSGIEIKIFREYSQARDWLLTG